MNHSHPYLEGEALAADVAVEGLVARVLADVILQLVLARVLLPADATREGRDAHVKPHVAVQAALLVEGLAAVDAGETRVVAEPAVAHLLPQVVLVAAHIEGGVLLALMRKYVNTEPEHASLDLKSKRHFCWENSECPLPI